MKLCVIFLLGWMMGWAVLFAQSSPQPIDLLDVSKMTANERAKFYQTLEPKNLANVNDFIPALIQGMNDPEESVRLAAAGKSAYAMIGLQEIRQQGQPITVSADQIATLKSKLKDAINDASAQVRGPAMAALIYSDAPNSESESALLNRLAQEDAELRFSALKDMVQAGYQSAAVKDATLAGLDANNWRERAKAADVIAQLKPDEALPKLAALLKVESGNVEQLSALHEIISAIAAYGSKASAYLPELERLLLDPSIGGTLSDRIRAAIATIKNPPLQPAATAQIKPVSLVDTTSPPPSFTATAKPFPPAATPSLKQSSSPSQSTGAESPPAGFSIVPVAILAAVIAGIVLYLLLHKLK